MTQQEVIDILKQVKKDFELKAAKAFSGYIFELNDQDQYHCKKYSDASDALGMAIFTLEKQDVSEINVGDTISRQAAIEVASRECQEWRGIFARIEDGLKELPPAQPKQKWISCNDRLPEVGRSVLFSVGGMYTAEGCLRSDGDWTEFHWNALQRSDMVDAWMPLLKPYKEEQKE